MSSDQFLRQVATVRSTLTDRHSAPMQGSEGAPDAWLDFEPSFVPALHGLRVGQEVFVITWLHQSDRDTLQVHPRGDTRTPLAGVFATRSPDRPNPLGLHPVTIRRIEGNRMEVGPLEVVDGTPVVDLKPVLSCER